MSYSKSNMERTVIFLFLSMSSNVKALEAVAVIALLLDDNDEEKENLIKRSQWVRQWMSRRKTDGAFHTIFQEVKEGDAEGFQASGSSNTVFTEESYKYERVHKTTGNVLLRP